MDVSDDGFGASGLTEVLTEPLVPSVYFQGDQPYCTSFAVASALRHVGLDGLANFILEQKERLLNSIKQPIVETVALLRGECKDALPPYTGWKETTRIVKCSSIAHEYHAPQSTPPSKGTVHANVGKPERL